MQVLRPISEAEYAAWLAAAIPAYAADKVATGRWPAEDAVDLARQEYEQLLPQGPMTEGNHFFAVLDASGAAVGSVWFAEAPRVGYRVAYVFDLVVHPEFRRRGHARRALQALEAEVTSRGLAGIALQVFGHNESARALYAQLGYEPTHLNLYKPLAAITRSLLAIRRAAPADAGAMLALQRRAFVEEARRSGTEDIPPLTETLDAIAAHIERETAIVATLGDRIVGCVRGVVESRVATIRGLVVDPAHHGHGIGSTLLKALEAALPTVERIDLTTSTLTEGNVPFYERHGYRVTEYTRPTRIITLAQMSKAVAGTPT